MKAERRPLAGTALQNIAAGDENTIPRDAVDTNDLMLCACPYCERMPIAFRAPLRGES